MTRTVVLPAFLAAACAGAVPRAAAAPPAASGQAPIRVAVRIVTVTDRALLARVRGQTSDLPAVLEPVPARALEASLDEQAAAARAIARAGAFAAVVWFTVAPERGALVVHVSHPEIREILVRVIDAREDAPPASSPASSSPPPPSSAALESAALVVRTALRTLATAGTVSAPVEAAAPAPARGDGAPPPARRASVSLAAMLAIDGVTPWGQPGLAAAAALAWTRLRADVAAAATLPTPVTDAHATVSLARATVSAGLAARHQASARLVVSAGVRAGVATFFRRTTPRAPGVVATPATATASPLLAPEVAAAWRPSASRALAFAAILAADYLPLAPALAYEHAGARTELRPPLPVQPRLALGVVFGDL